MAKKGNIVKRTKSDIFLLIVILVVICWVCVVFNLGVDKEKKEQTALIEQAKIYLEDKLYIRAVRNYKEAISGYTTDKNYELETELLNLYSDAAMWDDYYSLITERVERKTAAEEEYLILSEKFIEEGNHKKAIPVLQSGIKEFQNEEMIQKKESIIYENRTRTINLPELKQPDTNWMVPAYDGAKWGYVSDRGSVVLDFLYEDATSFCDRYAVVKIDGVYTLIDENGYWNAVDKIGLEFVTDISKTAIIGKKNDKYKIYSRTFQALSDEEYDTVYLNGNGLYVVEKEGKWAILSSELKNITDYVFTGVAVNSKGEVFSDNYAIVEDEKGYFLINQKGEALYDKRFYDAKGFEGGLYAVANELGKWGFANESGELIIDFQYVDACSFSCNLAAVEFGGKWGYINRYNDMIIDAKYDGALPFVEGKALAKNDLGNFEIITLRYYDLF